MTTTEEPSRMMMGRDAINNALDLAMTNDPKVFMLGEDIADPGGGVYGVTRGLSAKHGLHRVRPTPISEQAIVGAAIGAAIAGYRPVAEIMIMDFFAVCMDQVSNHAAKLRYMSGGATTVPLTIRCSAGGGNSLGAQHSEMLEAWLTHIPGLKVAIASNPKDAKGLLTTCIYDDDPCIFIEQLMGYFSACEVPEGDYRVPLGKADIKREGSDVTVISYGRQVGEALGAAEKLAEGGISVEVLDLRWLQPLDETAILESVGRTRRAVIYHEAVTRGGLGAEIAAIITESLFGTLEGAVVRVGAKNTPIPYARSLEQDCLPTAADLIHAVEMLVKS